MDLGDLSEQFFRRGWVRLPADDAAAAWVDAVRPVADELANDPQHQADWLRCGGTWFAGVNILPNDTAAAIPDRGVPPLAGGATAFIQQVLGFERIDWDPAQISVCYPGYPQPWDGETEAAFRFRRDRDAAHVDGLLRIMPERRRRVGEVHGFILGLPLSENPGEAAPLVVWEGSHELMRRAFRDRFAGIAPKDWEAEDITDTYVATRRLAFETCPRVPVTAAPGEAYIVHRLALHGVAPWTAPSGPARSIAYLRPNPFPGVPPDWWLDRP
ncbi:MAG: hypothetical protein AAF674_08460 [Pseudomonadota bacterium]